MAMRIINNDDRFITKEMISNKKFLMRLYLDLASHRQSNSDVINYNSLKELAEELNVNEKSFNRQLKALEADGIITVNKKARHIRINKIELEKGQFMTITKAEYKKLVAIGADDFVVSLYCYIKFLINKFRNSDCNQTQEQLLEALGYSVNRTNKQKVQKAVEMLEEGFLLNIKNYLSNGRKRKQYFLVEATSAEQKKADLLKKKIAKEEERLAKEEINLSYVGAVASNSSSAFVF